MLSVNVAQIKTKFSHYLNLVQQGKSIVISKRNIPIARISPIEKDQPQRLIGQSEKKFEVPDEFFKALPKKIIEAFNNPK